MTNKTQLLTSLRYEYLKRHVVRDGSNRTTDIYEAPVGAENGAPALRTQYTYFGATTVIENSRESESTWDSNWDIP
jgi:hypothetical protein